MIMKNVSRDIDQVYYYTKVLIYRLMTACRAICEDERRTIEHQQNDEDEELPREDINKLLPELALIEYVFQIDLLMTFAFFAELFESIPTPSHYDNAVWPIPYDFTPDNVYDNGKYDINLTFGKQAPK